MSGAGADVAQKIEATGLASGMGICMKRKVGFLRSVAVAIGIAFSVSAHAGSGQGQILNNWHIYGDGNLFFYLTGTHSGSPCSIPDRWAFDTTSPIGKSYYAAFLFAYATGKTVFVSGAGGCTHGNTETVFNFHVLD